MKTLIFTELPNGNLLIKATNEGIERIKDSKEQKDYESIWLDLLEYTACNGSYQWLNPEKISALTDAPIITDEVFWSDEPYDAVEIGYGKVWWFPDYAITNELEKLENGEEIEFQSAA